jgi:hypothetical protein
MASTPLLGLSLPADGTTNWGTLVNTSITALLDSAVAGTTTLSSDTDVTLSTTTEAANQARQAIILWNATGTVTRNITAPAQSKTYVVINATGGTQSIVFRATGPTTGVTIPAGKAFMLVWNGSDFVTTGVTTVNLATDVTGVLPIANGGTSQNNRQAAINALVGTQVANRVLRSDGTNSTLAQVALATDVSGILPTANGGTNLSSFTANRVFYASSSSVMSQSSALTFDGAKLGVDDVGVGRGAGAISTNTAIGNGAISNNTTGAQNTALGNAALNQNLTGNAQTALGMNTMAVMRGSANTAVGQGAMYGSGTIANNTGSSNVAIGQGAMSGLSSGSNNVGVGVGVVVSLTTGYSNTAVGYNAAYSSTTGYENTAVGINALYNNTTGLGSVAVGKGALYFMNSGGGNVGAGYEVMQGSGTPANNTGYNNVAIGWRALYSISSAHTNVALGYLAGSDITTGTKNTILGSYSGNQGGLDIRTASNYIVLSDGDGNPRAYWNAANAIFKGSLELIGGRLITGIVSISSAATITPTADSGNQYCINALATNATINAPSGTPGDGQKMLLRIKDNGVSRTLSWSASYRVIGTTLPSTTTASKITYVGCVYNAPDGVWDVVAVTTQA